jgi:hypothetical protein
MSPELIAEKYGFPELIAEISTLPAKVPMRHPGAAGEQSPICGHPATGPAAFYPQAADPMSAFYQQASATPAFYPQASATPARGA